LNQFAATFLVVRAQIHPFVKRSYFFLITVELQRLAAAKLAQAALGGLRPARVLKAMNGYGYLKGP